jgi:hypothetical protein
MEKTLVVVSRKWHEPFIRVDVTGVGIAVSMTMEDFIEAIRQETGHDVSAAARRVIEFVKQESTKAM